MSRMTGLFSFLVAVYLGTFVYWLGYPLASDFTKFYASAQQMREGVSIYQRVDAARYDPDKVAEIGSFLLHPNLNPPFFTLLMLPFAWLPWSLASVLFAAASMAAGFLSMRLLGRELQIFQTDGEAILPYLILLLFFPTWATIRFNQISLFLLLLLVIAWRDLRVGREARAGILLGLLMAVKIFTGLILLPLLLRGRLTTTAAAILTVSASWGLSLAIFGTGILAEYRLSLSHITWTGASWNASLQGFFSRIFGGSDGIPLWQAPQFGRIFTALLGVGLTLALVWVARRRQHDPVHDETSFLLSLPLMLLLSPLGWMYYFPILLLPAGVLWRRGRHVETAIFLGLATLPFPFIEAGGVNGYLDWFLFSGVYVYALCWLTFVLIRETREAPP